MTAAADVSGGPTVEHPSSGSPQPTASIIIAVLNAADDLARTLASIAEQGDLGLEIIVVDGGSTDATLDVVRACELPLTVISGPDDGIYDAMNKGAARADGRWLQFLNAGEVFTTALSLTAVFDGLRRADSADRTWLVAGARYVGGVHDGMPVLNLPHVWYRHALGLQPHCHQATWFRADLFSALGGYSLDYGFVGDFDLIMRWGMLGAPEMVFETVIDYARGGLSDQRASEIPGLLRRVRQDRLQLGGLAPALDRIAGALRFSDRARAAVRRRRAALRARVSSRPAPPH